jgi:hypothetical protein
MTRDTAILLDIVSTVFHPQEASRVSFALHLSPFTHMQLYRRLQHISTSGSAAGHPPPRWGGCPTPQICSAGQKPPGTSLSSLSYKVKMERALLHFAQTPHTITGLMARYCASLGAVAV